MQNAVTLKELGRLYKKLAEPVGISPENFFDMIAFGVVTIPQLLEWEREQKTLSAV